MFEVFGIDDVKDELMARYTPVITWKRVRHTTCKRDPSRQVEVREVYRCDPRDAVADAVRYLQRLNERYLQREVLKTRRVTFSAAAGGPKAIYSTRKMWPPDDCGFTDRYVLEGFTHQQVWEIDDAMMRFMYGFMHGRGPYAESIVESVLGSEGGMDAKDFLLSGPDQEVRVEPDGTRVWYQNGRLHRLDGPALENADGTRYWYQNGKLHRLGGPAVERSDGTRYWYQNGKLHRLDGPAEEWPNGTRLWYQNNKRHRLDRPAIEFPDGTRYWYRNGKLHRLDGPAVENADGTRYWYRNGKRHRLDGPAVEKPNGTREWYQNDKLHRLDGPAVEFPNGTREWYQNGKLHRLDGPAVERSDGTREWWENGVSIR